MQKPAKSTVPLKRSTLLAIAVGWLSQLGLKMLLPICLLIAIRIWSLETGDQSLWLENPDDVRHPVWFLLQASIFVGSAVGGILAARLSPQGSFAVPIWLVLLSLLATIFEQVPRPMSTTVGIIWSVGPCAGLLVGYLLTKHFKRGDV